MIHSHYKSLCLISFFVFSVFSCSQSTSTEIQDFKSISYASYDLKTYTLKNGLTVYMVPREKTSSIYATVVVGAGSTREPSTATGLAHYLEHLLTQGTDSISSISYNKEKPILEKISSLYEENRQETNPTKKRVISKWIDSLSYEASKYSNDEHRDLLFSLGAYNNNASTSSDRTNYFNEIPCNILKHWITIYAELFRNPVFRNFNRELNAVYEELSDYYGNGYFLTKIKLYENTLPEGEFYRDPLGKPEHVLNPSIVETKKFFDTYYVPNNMAITLVGNFNPEEAIEMIEASHFSQMEPKQLPIMKVNNSPYLTSNKEMEIRSQEGESLAMCFVVPPPSNEEHHLFELTEMIFLNGIMDITNDIGISGKSSNWLNARPEIHKDFAFHYIESEPKKGVSLKQLKDSILKDIDKLKTGDYPNWLIKACAQDLKRRQLSVINNETITLDLTNMISLEVPFENNYEKVSKFENVTKSDLMKFAKKYYGNYSIVYNKKGENKLNDFKNVISTPLSNLNSQKKSVFAKKIKSMKTQDIKFTTIDFNNELERISLSNGATVLHATNESNDLFKLRIPIQKTSQNKVLTILDEYFTVVELDDFNSKLYKLGASLKIREREDQFIILIHGMSESFSSVISLVYELFTNLTPDQSSFTKVKKSILEQIEKRRAYNRFTNKKSIDFAMYGMKNSIQKEIGKSDVENLNVDNFVNKVQALLTSSQLELYLYSSLDRNEIEDSFNSFFNKKPKINSVEKTAPQKILNHRNNVYLVDYKSDRFNIHYLTNFDKFRQEDIVKNKLLVSYSKFLLFDEIRGKRGLAYYVTTSFKDDKTTVPNSFYATMSVDRSTYLEAVKAMTDVIRNLPLEKQVFEDRKEAYLKILKSARYHGESVLNLYESSKNYGYDNKDYRIQVIKALQSITFDDFKEHYQKYVKDSYFNLIVVGDLSKINQEELKPFGEVKVLSSQELFGE